MEGGEGKLLVDVVAGRPENDTNVLSRGRSLTRRMTGDSGAIQGSLMLKWKMEIWNPVLVLLCSYDLCHLMLTGNKRVIERLCTMVVEFRHHPRGVSRFFWPKMISSFINLKTLIIASLNQCDPPPYLYGIDLTSVPSSVEVLKLEVANGFFALMSAPSPAHLRTLHCSTMNNLSAKYPNLRYLSWRDDYESCSNIESIFTSSLTSLHLPSTPTLSPASAARLPLTLTELSFTVSGEMGRWDSIRFPPALLTLHLSRVPSNFHQFVLPSQLQSLTLVKYEGNKWKGPKMPSSLLYFSLTDSSLSLSSSFFSTLPAHLTHLHLSVDVLFPDTTTWMPPKIQIIDISTLSPLPFLPLPPNLCELRQAPSCVFSQDCRTWHRLPRGLVKLKGPFFIPIPFDPSAIPIEPSYLSIAELLSEKVSLGARRDERGNPFLPPPPTTHADSTYNLDEEVRHAYVELQIMDDKRRPVHQNLETMEAKSLHAKGQMVTGAVQVAENRRMNAVNVRLFEGTSLDGNRQVIGATMESNVGQALQFAGDEMQMESKETQMASKEMQMESKETQMASKETQMASKEGHSTINHPPTDHKIQRPTNNHARLRKDGQSIYEDGLSMARSTALGGRSNGPPLHFLPPSLTSLSFCGVPREIPFPMLKKLILKVEREEEMKLVIHLLCSPSLRSQLTSLSLLGICMDHLGIMECLRGSALKKLELEESDVRKWSSLSGDWAHLLSSLSIHRGPWRPVTHLALGEEISTKKPSQDFQNASLIHRDNPSPINIDHLVHPLSISHEADHSQNSSSVYQTTEKSPVHTPHSDMVHHREPSMQWGVGGEMCDAFPPSGHGHIHHAQHASASKRHTQVNHCQVNHRQVNHRQVNHCQVNHCQVNHAQQASASNHGGDHQKFSNLENTQEIVLGHPLLWNWKDDVENEPFWPSLLPFDSNLKSLKLGPGLIPLSSCSPNHYPLWPSTLTKLVVRDCLELTRWATLPPLLVHLDMPAYGAELFSANTLLSSLSSLPKSLTYLRLMGIYPEDESHAFTFPLRSWLSSPHLNLNTLHDSSRSLNWIHMLSKPTWYEAISTAVNLKRSSTPFSSPLRPSTPLLLPVHPSSHSHFFSSPHSHPIDENL